MTIPEKYNDAPICFIQPHCHEKYRGSFVQRPQKKVKKLVISANLTRFVCANEILPFIEAIEIHPNNAHFRVVNNALIQKNEIINMFGCTHLDISIPIDNIYPNAWDRNKITELTTYAMTHLSMYRKYLNGLRVVHYTHNPDIGFQRVVFRVIQDAYRLQKIELPANHPFYHVEDDVIFSKDKKTLFFYPPMKTDVEYAIPDTVETIADSAFAHNAFLRHVAMPDSVTTIEQSAFEECAALSSMTFSKNLAKIEDNAFMNTPVREIVLPKTLENIGKQVFNCYPKSDTEEPRDQTQRVATNPNDTKTVREIWLTESQCARLLKTWTEELYCMHVQRDDGSVMDLKIPATFTGIRLNYPSFDEMLDACMAFIKQNDDKLRFASSVCQYPGSHPTMITFIKKFQARLATQFLKKGDEDAVIDIIKTHMMTEAALQKLMEDSVACSRPAITAYILEELSSRPSKKRRSLSL